jgi:protein AbiQ
MEIKGLTNSAYLRVSQGRPQVLQKNRGYGIIAITVRNITFAVPLRSNLNHPNGLKTIFIKGAWNGLDYTKALLVEEADITQESFQLREQKEFDKIIKNKDKIINEFSQYVTDYIAYASSKNKVFEQMFQYTTLQYFHNELGIS